MTDPTSVLSGISDDKYTLLYGHYLSVFGLVYLFGQTGTSLYLILGVIQAVLTPVLHNFILGIVWAMDDFSQDANEIEDKVMNLSARVLFITFMIGIPSSLLYLVSLFIYYPHLNNVVIALLFVVQGMLLIKWVSRWFISKSGLSVSDGISLRQLVEDGQTSLDRFREEDD